MPLDSGYKWAHVQLVCTTPYLLHREGPGDKVTSRTVITRDEFQPVLFAHGLPKYCEIR